MPGGKPLSRVGLPLIFLKTDGVRTRRIHDNHAVLLNESSFLVRSTGTSLPAMISGENVYACSQVSRAPNNCSASTQHFLGGTSSDKESSFRATALELRRTARPALLTLGQDPSGNDHQKLGDHLQYPSPHALAGYNSHQSIYRHLPNHYPFQLSVIQC